jgi:hypothetical protein
MQEVDGFEPYLHIFSWNHVHRAKQHQPASFPPKEVILCDFLASYVIIGWRNMKNQEITLGSDKCFVGDLEVGVLHFKS